MVSIRTAIASRAHYAISGVLLSYAVPLYGGGEELGWDKVHVACYSTSGASLAIAVAVGDRVWNGAKYTMKSTTISNRFLIGGYIPSGVLFGYKLYNATKNMPHGKFKKVDQDALMESAISCAVVAAVPLATRNYLNGGRFFRNKYFLASGLVYTFGMYLIGKDKVWLTYMFFRHLVPFNDEKFNNFMLTLPADDVVHFLYIIAQGSEEEPLEELEELRSFLVEYHSKTKEFEHSDEDQIRLKKHLNVAYQLVDNGRMQKED